ncbi:glutaminyl-peptide cyclotransferase [Inquilinus sp. KBS0705]|nr:glutaminyl-peptide cyclotransferase [Inquilinus sp. KBS0705]
MNKRIIFLALIALVAYGCKDNKKQDDFVISPDAGSTYKAGETISLKLTYANSIKPDSIVFLLDSARVGSVKDSSALNLKTDTMALGARVITAKVYQAGKSQEVTTNIVLYPAKAPEELTYKVEKTFPHDIGSYTEGLEYHDGALYESSGGYLDPPPGQSKDQQSSLIKADLTTGKILKKVMIDPKVFAEGIAIIGDKLIQLTYHEKKGFIYDKNTFKVLGNFSTEFAPEGWGMYFDGNKIYMDDGTNRIWTLNKDTYRPTGYIDVYDDKGAVDSINELEMINGKLYANVYQKDVILVIDPKTGAVLQKVDMTNLWPEGARPPGYDNLNNVLNGIAYDKATGRIFVTGKKWPKLYQVKFVKK